MIAALAALALAAAPGPAADHGYDRRMWQSAAAAQTLQGGLDGAWTLSDAQGRALYGLQIADPPQTTAPLQAAWRDARTGALGPVATIGRTHDRLTLVFAGGPSNAEARLSLRRETRDLWRGWLILAGVRRPVRLSRNADAGSSFFRPAAEP